MYEWYFLAVEENDSFTPIQETKSDTIEAVKEYRNNPDYENLPIIKIELVEG